ncbi:MAG: DUF58 domain-containing protein [Azoarcus sp.]|jgi:uncharacterized protein (DUF58 family)|nr:DUF58 domain-containing protein [Azoarcus sp.]
MNMPAIFARILPRLRGACAGGRRRPRETAPVRLGQHRIYVLPTFPGLSFAGALGVMLVTSINYNLSLGYAFTFLLAGAAIASAIHAFRNLLGLSIRYGRVEAAFCGGSAVFHLLIDNPHPRRRAALELTRGGRGNPPERGRILFDLPPAACSEIGFALPARRRGILPFAHAVIETRWPLGLVRAWSVLTPDMEALVFPAPESRPPALPPGRNKASGEATDTSRAGNEDFVGLRAYRDTDSPRHLAWKVFARGGELMTKQFSVPEGGDLFLDWHALPETLAEEKRLSRLAAWLLRAEQDGRRYALRLPAREIPASRGEAHLYRCLGALAVHGIARESESP